MTDDTTEDEAEAETPEMTSYDITTKRRFEMDFSNQQVESLIQQTSAESAEDAIEQILLQREIENIEPEQKLAGADVQAEEAD